MKLSAIYKWNDNKAPFTVSISSLHSTQIIIATKWMTSQTVRIIIYLSIIRNILSMTMAKRCVFHSRRQHEIEHVLKKTLKT